MLIAAAAMTASVLQGLVMSWDEFILHRKRRLGRVESWGHVVDSLFYLIPLMIAALAPPSSAWKAAFCCAAAIACALITKDEWIHSNECDATEHWAHSVLFILHPCALIPIGMCWVHGEAASLRGALPVVVAVFSVYQASYWIVLDHSRRGEQSRVNNDFYGELGELWHEGDAHAIALLRAETRERLAYIRDSFRREGVAAPARILDVGCGGGLVSNALACDGYRVKGVDAASGALSVARAHVPAGADATYDVADAYALAEPNAAYDAVLLLDVLEHFEQPARAVAEAARVLRPGGILVAHTFNRTWLGWLLAVKGVQFVVRDCPPDLHVYRLLVTPGELRDMAASAGLAQTDLCGIRPRIACWPFWWSLLHRRVHPDFSFVRSSSLAAGYLACFTKPGSC